MKTARKFIHGIFNKAHRIPLLNGTELKLHDVHQPGKKKENILTL